MQHVPCNLILCRAVRQGYHRTCLGKIFIGQGLPFTSIRDPKIDEKPPPYDCSDCGFSTWSWNEAKAHRCKTVAQDLGKAGAGIMSFDRSTTVEKDFYQKGSVEQLVLMVFKAQEEHPEWSKKQILEHIKESIERKVS